VSTQTIREAYEGRLATWAAGRSTPLRVAFENVPFTPAGGETYLRVHILPARTVSADLEGDHRGYRGVCQVSIVCPINVGAGAAGNTADEIAALFPVNLRVTREGMTVQVITPASVAPALPTDSSFTVPVSFEYRADTI